MFVYVELSCNDFWYVVILGMFWVSVVKNIGIGVWVVVVVVECVGSLGVCVWVGSLRILVCCWGDIVVFIYNE